ELATGEGKTFAAALAAGYWALDGRGCHILTANDYLAERDARWLEPVYQALGLSCAFVIQGMAPNERRAAYQADITYLTAREAGYDYLRDRLAGAPAELVQRGLDSALVDEADCLLIDEARSPLVIADRADGAPEDLTVFGAIAGSLVPGQDFQAEANSHGLGLTLAGQERVASALGSGGMHQPEDRERFARVHAALYARCFLERDRDYLVKAASLQLVDELTGRVAQGRRWPYGVQAAVEAREGLPPVAESAILGSITLQRFIPLYRRIAAMTATAAPAAEEFFTIYGLAVHVIPPRLPSRRVDAPDRLFRTIAGKEAAIVAEVAAEQERGRPVLLATSSVADSERLADQLRAAGVPCQVLNARNDQDEALAIAAAGCQGAVTVSTDMAGRGTDIQLGGPQASAAERTRLAKLGGLYVLGCARRESRRLDDQLRGRAGRQGDPGLTRFYCSLEDPLFARYGVAAFLPPEYLQSIGPADSELHDRRASREIDRAQRLIEGHHHRVRDARRRSSQLFELHRRRIASLREACLFGLDGDVRRGRLAAIDGFWTEHLAAYEELREGIHLVRYAGRDPDREFDRRLDEAFEAGLSACGLRDGDDASAAEASASAAEADVSAWPARRPGGAGATWTYQIDEEPVEPFRLPSVMNGASLVESVVQVPLSLLRALRAIWRRWRRT
ncbi:MAG: hypothetical protein A2004_01250, partial [Spirochaetes bacterium GWC1_61_12]